MCVNESNISSDEVLPIKMYDVAVYLSLALTRFVISATCEMHFFSSFGSLNFLYIWTQENKNNDLQ